MYRQLFCRSCAGPASPSGRRRRPEARHDVEQGQVVLARREPTTTTRRSLARRVGVGITAEADDGLRLYITGGSPAACIIVHTVRNRRGAPRPAARGSRHRRAGRAGLGFCPSSHASRLQHHPGRASTAFTPWRSPISPASASRARSSPCTSANRGLGSKCPNHSSNPCWSVCADSPPRYARARRPGSRGHGCAPSARAIDQPAPQRADRLVADEHHVVPRRPRLASLSDAGCVRH